MKSFSVAALAILLLLLAGCGAEAPRAPGAFELRGPLAADPTGEHDFALDFGRVGARAQGAVALELRNESGSAWEAEVRTRGRAFDAPMRLQLPPGAAVPFSVGLRGLAPGHTEGVLEIDLPDTTLTVALVGEVVEGCLEAPASLVFDATAEGCWTEPARISLRNSCSHPIRIFSIEFPPGDWFVRSAPILPAVVEAHSSEWVDLQFTPRTPDRLRATIRFRDETGDETAVRLEGRGTQRTRVRHLDRQGMRADADRLYVVDDSKAMAPWAERLDEWLRAVEPALDEIDLRAGLTTASRHPTPGCAGSGAGGRLLPVGGDGRILDRIDVRDGLLAARAALPFCSEAPNEILAAAVHAIELTEVVDDPATPAPGDGNHGLRRADVPLQVFLVSASDDASPGRLDEWFDRLRALQRDADVRFVALLASDGCEPLPENHRIGVLADALRARVHHLCDPPTSGPWALLRHDWPLRRRFELPDIPADIDFDGEVTEATEAFSVRVEGRPLPQELPDGGLRWRVHPLVPSVDFAPGHEPDEDEVVEFEYLPACG